MLTETMKYHFSIIIQRLKNMIHDIGEVWGNELHTLSAGVVNLFTISGKQYVSVAFHIFTSF